MKGMTVIVKTITRVTIGGIVLFGFYLFMHGHISHGVGFAGGVIIALALVQIMLAFGKDEIVRRVGAQRAIFIAGIMLLLLLALALIGLWSSTGFAGNYLPKGKPFELFSAGLVVIENAALCLAAAASLFWIFLSLVQFRGEGEGE
jgi:multicomponent Na+:H+ antiporter subunit B